MNRKELYFKNTKILIDAYQNELLIHDNWGGCIDAHLIAGNMGFTVTPFFYRREFCGMRWENEGEDVRCYRHWGSVLEAKKGSERRKVRNKMGKEAYRCARKCLAATGYTYKELKEIMEIFDACYDGKDQGNNILPGLKAVLARLKQIHAVSEKDKTFTFKKAFEQEQQLIECLADGKFSWLKLHEQDKNFNWNTYQVQNQRRDTVNVIRVGIDALATRKTEKMETSLS